MRELYHQRVQRWASEIFLSRHQCSWRAPVRRLLATVLRKKTFAFLLGGNWITVECSKCGRREGISGEEIHVWGYRV